MFDGEIIGYEEVVTPKNKHIRTLVDSPLLSEFVTNDFPFIWVFWADGTLVYPDHDRFPVINYTNVNTKETLYVNASDYLDPEDALAEIEERPTSTGNPSLGWPNGQTITSCEGTQNIDLFGTNNARIAYSASCHPPRIFGRDRTPLSVPRCVRLIVCNYDQEYRPTNISTQVTGKTHWIEAPNSYELVPTLNRPPGATTSIWYYYKKRGFELNSTFGYEGYTNLFGAYGTEIFGENYAKTWTKRQVDFDEKWRKVLMDVAIKFPSIDFQFIPCTKGGMLSRVFETSKTLSGVQDKNALIQKHTNRNWDVDTSVYNLENDPLGTALLPRRAPTIERDVEAVYPDLYPIGYVYGEVLNIVVIRSSTVNGVPPYWKYNAAMHPQLGATDFTAELIGLDETILERFAIEIPKFVRNETYVYLDNGRLDLTQYFYNHFDLTGQGKIYEAWEITWWNCTIPPSERRLETYHLYVTIGTEVFDVYDQITDSYDLEKIEEYLAQGNSTLEPYNYDPITQQELPYHLPVKLTRALLGNALVFWTPLGIYNASGQTCLYTSMGYAQSRIDANALPTQLVKGLDNKIVALELLILDVGYHKDMRDESERMLEEFETQYANDLNLTYKGRIDIDAPLTVLDAPRKVLTQIISEYYATTEVET